jgi:D-beta-D-heptose 7-phosphate kinase / D-beta-D-heptose 1-phosphate adenosyltransferase
MPPNNLNKEFLKRARSKRLNIHCVGDAIVDEYYDVKIQRISQEFPIPIMWSAHGNAVSKPGGCANVAYQFKHFDVESTLICFYDAYACSVFSDHDIHWQAILDSFSGIRSCLPIKRRFLNGHIQVARHDIESKNCGLSEELIDFATERLAHTVPNMPKPDIVILSDYNKGFFASEEHNVLSLYPDSITIVDPKKGPLSQWEGCTIFKPNATEAIELSGRTNWREQAKHFENELGCKGVVITFGGEKVAGVYEGEFFCYRPDKKVEVESVIGAGDCFCAFLAMAVGYGFGLPEAAEIAWNAGSVYVQQNMNRPIVPAELSEDGIVEPEDCASRDFKLGFTNGCFDILHEGHLSTLRFAKSKCDKLVVALNTDESVRRLKGANRPIKPLEQRMAVMSALDMVDFVVSFDEDEPRKILEIIKPDLLVKGSGYCIDDIVGSDLVSEVLVAPSVPNLSTTGFCKWEQEEKT